MYHLSTLDSESQEEEEIFIHKNTVIWSRGYGDIYWELVRKYTSDCPVQQALWFEFDQNPNRPACATIPPPSNGPVGQKIPSLCIVELSKVTVYTRDGDEYVCAVPYEIQRVWPTRFGLVIEKRPTSNPEIPNWFSLYHPLVSSCPGKRKISTVVKFLFCFRLILFTLQEEIMPVVLRDGSDRDHVNFAKDKKLKFVYTGANPSICVTFNEDTGLHSIWFVFVKCLFLLSLI